MSGNTSREAFEAWWKDYADEDSDEVSAQDAWKASRKQALSDAAKACASVCTPNLNSFGDGYNQGAIDCESRIKELK